MTKKTIAIIMLVLFTAAAALTGCTKNESDKITVAKIDGEKVTKSEYLESWENVKDNYGITQDTLDDPQYADQLDGLRKSVLESVVSQKVTRIELENMGYYDLTEDEHNTVMSQVDAFLQTALSYKQSEMMAELGEEYTEREYAKAVQKYTQLALEDYGVDEEYIKDYYTYDVVMANAQADLIDLTVTDEYLKELYNQRVEEDKETFTDLSAYEYYTMQEGYKPYYVPEGIRNVRHVLIALPDETISEIQNLRSDGDDEAADKLAEKARKAIYDEAMDVLTQLKEGTITFDTAILNYNDDPGMDSSPEGYQMSLGSLSYVQEFTDAGMALKNIGDISELVPTDFGYHIIEYYSDVPSGPIDFETVKEALSEEAVDSKRDDGWLALVDEWLAKHEIEYFYENVLETPASAEEAAEAPAQE